MTDELSYRIYHEPVLVDEVLSFVLERQRNVVLDCTLGDGGHAWEILSKDSEVFILGIDVDDDAVRTANARLGSRFCDRFHATRGNYKEIHVFLAELAVPRVGAILLDLGVSSRQLDQTHRGFSYWGDAPLDMRMDLLQRQSAQDILAVSSQDEIERILREYGEERYSKGIAQKIVEQRTKNAMKTTKDLVEAIKAAIPARARYQSGHPARKTFQALRIATNDELSQLSNALRRCFSLLEPAGVLLVITYHSLEDRIVKKVFKDIELEKLGTVRTKKVLRPSEVEVSVNPRSRSAKLRVIQQREVREKGKL